MRQLTEQDLERSYKRLNKAVKKKFDNNHEVSQECKLDWLNKQLNVQICIWTVKPIAIIHTAPSNLTTNQAIQWIQGL